MIPVGGIPKKEDAIGGRNVEGTKGQRLLMRSDATDGYVLRYGVDFVRRLIS